MVTGQKVTVAMSKDIASKKYKKLSIQISLNGLSFYSLNTINNVPTEVITVPIEEYSAQQVTSVIDTAFSVNTIIPEMYDTVTIIHENNLFTPVPSNLFDKKDLPEYLKYTTKTLVFDDFKYDVIDNHTISNVYVTIEKVLESKLGLFNTIEHKHFTSVLIKRLLDISKNSYELQFFVHVQQYHFEIIVIEKGQLQLINSFEYTSKEDFLYYILFVSEQLKLNPEEFSLVFLGSISIDHELYDITYKYIRNVKFIDQNQLNPNAWDLSAQTCLNHFSLLNA